jgi:PhzF family phenazine biosynthesis protein
MLVHELTCFGTRPGQGNVALVVEHGPATAMERQAFATERAAPACVFLTSGEAIEADFYYPHTRSPLCLHATLAAAHILLARGGPATLITAMRGQRIELERSGGNTFAGVRRQAVAPLAVSAAQAAHLLGEPALRLAAPPLLSSVGSPKLLIEVADRQALHALRPPLERIVEWGKENGVNGCYVYCRMDEQTYEGRNFNHLDPAREDSATGVAAGALSAWLGRGLTLYQGEQLGNPCRIVTRIEGEEIFIGGATHSAGN